MKRKIISLVLILSLSALANIGPFPGGAGSSSSGGGGGGGGGTVTSVDMSVPSLLSISGNPITTSGTLAVSYSGTALPVANGGTGATTLTSNNVILGNGTSAVQFVAPGTSGNLLTSNGTTWTSAAASFPTGSGTTGRFAKWSSSSALTATQWTEGSNGEQQYQNFSAAKGTATVPLFDLHPGSSAGTGEYTNTSFDLLLTAGGNLDANFTAGGELYLYTPGSTTNYLSISPGTGSTIFKGNGSNSGIFTFRGKDTSSQQKISLQDSSGGSGLLWEIETYGGGETGIPYYWAMKNHFNNVMTKTRGGLGIGGDVGDRLNGITLIPDANITNIRSGCTTTANNTTTITGSASCLFTQDFGIGDQVSLSSASSTYSYITAISGDTSMTVSANQPLGNGTSQTLNKKQSPLRIAASGTGTTYGQVFNNGDWQLGANLAGASVMQIKSGTVQIADEPASANPGSSLVYGKYIIHPFEYNSGASGTSKQIDFSRASSQLITMTGSVTFSFVNTQPGGSYVLRLLQDATGSRTATWPAAVKWSGGVAPALTSTAGKIDLINLYYDGTSYYGSYSLNY